MKVELNFLEKFNLAKICLEVFMAFVRSGVIRLDDGMLLNIGERGYGWSRVVHSLSNAYYLVVTSLDIFPTYATNRYIAFPFRCLYPGSV